LSRNVGRGGQLGLELRHTGKRWLRGDEANEEPPLSSHTIVDLRARRDLGLWSLEGVIRNLFDDRYSSFGGFNVNQGANGVVERFLTPGEPRLFHLIVRRQLN
jgi:hypothetical protein